MSDCIDCPVTDYNLTTKSKVVKIEHRWEIPDFLGKICEDWTNIDGPVISATESNVYWKLQLMPDSDGFLCVVVRQCERQQQRNAIAYNPQPTSNMKFYLVTYICDSNDTKVLGVGFTENPGRFVIVGQGCRWELIRRDVVLKDLERYLPDGKLTMLCTLHYLQPLETPTYAADQLKVPSPVVPPSEIVSCIASMFTGGLFSDVIVAAGEREFPAHRAILAQRSGVSTNV